MKLSKPDQSGRVTDIERFTEGDCWLLAARIHRITGWPFYSFPYSFGGEWVPDAHAFVVMPNGQALDIEGPCSIKNMAHRYGFTPADARELPVSSIRKHIGEPTFGHYSYERARVIADRLVAAHA